MKKLVEPCFSFHRFMVFTNKNLKTSSFKNSVNIQKKDVWTDGPVSNNLFSSVTRHELVMLARESIL